MLDPFRLHRVPSEPRVGYANGLWANAHGQGGTLPIEAHFYPTGEFLRLKLTGKQGDVMQESMNVALTLAYKLCPKELLDTVLDEIQFCYSNTVFMFIRQREQHPKMVPLLEVVSLLFYSVFLAIKR